MPRSSRSFWIVPFGERQAPDPCEMSILPKVFLKKGREKPFRNGHPWVFSGAVAKVDGDPSPGDVAEVYSSDGEFIGVAHVNLRSQIVCRFLSDKKEEIGSGFFRERFSKACLLRDEILPPGTNAYRLVNGEGDFLPGLVVDRYGETWVIQCLTAGMERSKPLLIDLLQKEYRAKWVYERSDAAVCAEEGLPERRGLLCGGERPEPVVIVEGGARFRVDVEKGQKTGFYLDQRENRLRLRALSQGKKVLDCFCYAGAFSIHAALGGARELTLVDSSQEALAAAEEHFLLNGLHGVKRQLIRGDAFEVMRELTGPYDIVILDPPPFARKKSHLYGASRGYKDLNLQALRLLKEGGLLLTFSCSHHMDWDLFQKVVFAAAVDGGRKVQLLERRGHPVDHPVNVCHPEGEYLKGFICRVI